MSEPQRDVQQAELANELREWCATLWDGLLYRAGLEDSERDRTIEQLAQIVEAHIGALSAWQPIETSPKDGTVFYINHPRGVRRAWWCGDGARLYYEAPGRGEIVDDVVTRWIAAPDAQKPGE